MSDPIVDAQVEGGGAVVEEVEELGLGFQVDNRQVHEPEIVDQRKRFSFRP